MKFFGTIYKQADVYKLLFNYAILAIITSIVFAICFIITVAVPVFIIHRILGQGV